VFSSTMIPQSVQTAEPEGPRDSIELDPQFGQRGAFDDCAPCGCRCCCGVDSLGLSVAESSFQKLSSRFQREEDMVRGEGGRGGEEGSASRRLRYLSIKLISSYYSV
jgi:hypothetical protein